MKKNFLIGIILIFATLSCSDNSGENKGKENSGGASAVDSDTIVDLSDSDLLDWVQKTSCKYFTDYAESNSGAARERYLEDNPEEDKNLVATGGSGFGLMNIIVAVKRGFVTEATGFQDLSKIISFFKNADRFHGAWPHWLNGTTGKVVPFSDEDDGGDLVETAYFAQGLIVVYEYYRSGTPEERALAEEAYNLWKGIEWNWYTGQGDALYWHWSPDYGFEGGLKITGYNECLIAYVLAASSPDYPITKDVYTKGWASSGGIRSANTKYGYPLVVNYSGYNEYGGPLFFSHYSFLGLNPEGLSDQYVNYGEAVENLAKIDYQYCVENPLGFRDYGGNCWGLTSSYSRASDGTLTYAVHCPGSNDVGVITPSAALSSFPYTPQESLSFLKYLYRLKDRLSGGAGFYDAFSPQYNYWVARAYLAIDQGPIAVMIENYRTKLFWTLFMRNEDVRSGLDKLGFSYE